jgi:gliding motility-associated-like protein
LSSGASSPYIDNNVVCATNYCYRIKTYLNSTSSLGAVYSLSANKCIDAISTTVPIAVTNVNSTVNGSATQVMFDAPVGFTVKKYYVFDGSGNTASSGTSNNVNFIGSPGNCYRVAYDDNCNNRSTVSPFTCTVNLTANLADDGSIALNWSAYSGYLSTGIASYDVLFLNENNQIVKTIPAGLGLTASDIPNENAGRLFYKIRVNAGGTENLISYSNLVEVSLEPAVYVPTAFTPNGDGTNDVFIAKSRFVKTLEMTIYNRWGEPVFKTTDLKTGWDGKVNGTDAPVGTYAYVINVEGNKGESSTERGSISLIR